MAKHLRENHDSILLSNYPNLKDKKDSKILCQAKEFNSDIYFNNPDWIESLNSKLNSLGYKTLIYSIEKNYRYPRLIIDNSSISLILNILLSEKEAKFGVEKNSLNQDSFIRENEELRNIMEHQKKEIDIFKKLLYKEQDRISVSIQNEKMISNLQKEIISAQNIIQNKDIEIKNLIHSNNTKNNEIGILNMKIGQSQLNFSRKLLKNTIKTGIK